MNKIVRILDDKREISRIVFPDLSVIGVGLNGITKISPYEENGQMACVTWLAIYKGEFLWQRVDSVGLSIQYKEGEG